MEIISPFSVMITSYEFDEDTGKYNPVLSHVAHGKTIKACVGILHSHLITDYFFTASMLGEFEWRDSIIEIDVEGQILREKQIKSHYATEDSAKQEKKIEKILEELKEQAEKVEKKQQKSGMIAAIKIIAGKEK